MCVIGNHDHPGHSLLDTGGNPLQNAVATGGQVNVSVNPAANDCDGDTVTDQNDNCLNVANGLQVNSDDNFVDTSPPRPVGQEDKTRANSDLLGDACELDDDNDGLLDTVESPGPPCGTATAATSSTNPDTDGDRVVDGAECAMGSNPNDSASRPAIPGAGIDPDGDRLNNAFEATLGTRPERLRHRR